MKLKTVVSILLFSTALPLFGIAQYSFIELDFPVSINPKDAAANGYFNPYTNSIILEQQHKNTITRLLYDTAFNLQKKYITSADLISLANDRKKPVFVKEFCSNEGLFELYAATDKIEVWQISFTDSADKRVSTILLRQKYKDEKLIALIPGKRKILLLTYSEKGNVLISYTYKPFTELVDTKEFLLPEKTLTTEEIKAHGKFLAVKYPQSFGQLYASDLEHPKKFELNTGGQLFYNDTSIYILLKMPYQVGYHLLDINLTDSKVSFTNFLINKVHADRNGLPSELNPVATAYDSLLIIQNSNANTLGYYFFSLRNKQLLAQYNVGTDKSFYTIVHSNLQQSGTYWSKDEEKEISSERLFMKRKNKGTPFLKAFKADNDSLILTFGSYNETEGVGGTLLSFATSAISSYFLYTPNFGMYQPVPYLTMSRYKFLFAYSKFSLNDLHPSYATNITTALNTLVKDKKMEDLEKESSFIIETNGRLYVGIFDKSKNKYRLAVY